MSFDILHQSFCVQMLGTAWSSISSRFLHGSRQVWADQSCASLGLCSCSLGQIWQEVPGDAWVFYPRVPPFHESSSGTRERLMFIHAAFGTRAPNPLLWASCSRAVPWSKRHLFSVSAKSWDCWIGEKPQRIPFQDRPPSVPAVCWCQSSELSGMCGQECVVMKLVYVCFFFSQGS